MKTDDICFREWPMIRGGVAAYMAQRPLRKRAAFARRTQPKRPDARKYREKPEVRATGLGRTTAEVLRDYPECDKTALLDLARTVEEGWAK